MGALIRQKFNQTFPGALSVKSADTAKAYVIRSVEFTVTGAGITSTLAINKTDEDDSTFDVELFTEALAAANDFAWLPEIGGAPAIVAANQQLELALTDPGGTETIKGSIIYELCT